MAKTKVVITKSTSSNPVSKDYDTRCANLAEQVNSVMEKAGFKEWMFTIKSKAGTYSTIIGTESTVTARRMASNVDRVVLEFITQQG